MTSTTGMQHDRRVLTSVPCCLVEALCEKRALSSSTNTSSSEGDGLLAPLSMDFPVPAPIIVAGQQRKKSKDASVRVAGGTSTMPPPPLPTLENKPAPTERPSAPDEAEGDRSLPPPPPKVATNQQDNAGGKAASGGGGGGGGYKPPSWGLTAAPESSGLSLTVLKGGIEVNSISLDNRTHVLLGEICCLGVPRYYTTKV